MNKREEVLQWLSDKVDYWASVKDEDIPEGQDKIAWRVDGLVFSLLVAVDNGEINLNRVFKHTDIELHDAWDKLRKELTDE